MRFSTVLASFATVCAVSAIPTSIFLPVGNLPSQPTTSSLVLKDLGVLDGAITALSGAVQRVIDFKKTAIGNGVSILRDVLEKTIAYQIATQTSRLNAQGISGNFSSADSTAIVDKLKNDVAPHLKTVTDLLATAKNAGILGINTSLPGFLVSILSPLGLVDYFELLKTDTAGFSAALLPYIDPSVLPDATNITSIINNLWNVTYSVYTT
ncbi:hypothetical protein ColTof4_11607 [Colletotrichum tofieldiae]|uniref:Antigenic cell wall galactomannoprotein n=1 Tax=Colletotrichum tofieldiae TaxID=708197 RepID=A0A166ZEJ7_9PEZI|nr:hypothetical protein CT0861_10528 [Colletotrichum tofieldiae]GKT55982.1 hypothetical protein ColTof3_03321 [Colletotrichum tofieldiae]GKT79184.1 hypothetical protein ColTof4_11607 [Colletotrichum tofieldiae]GKT82346.1 hypothetical protein Ct61P_00196 [Colletotrichum tofieldiae]